nr:PREDICTED: basic proline-rich protein-like [Bemisia tabaci]
MDPEQEREIMNGLAELEEDLCPDAEGSKRIFQPPIAPQPPFMPPTRASPPGSPGPSTPNPDHLSFFREVGDHLSQLPPGTPPPLSRPTSPRHFQPPPPPGSPTPDPFLRTKQLEQWLREVCPQDNSPKRTNAGLSPSRLSPPRPSLSPPRPSSSSPRPSSSPRAQGNGARWSPIRPPPPPASVETPIIYSGKRIDQIIAEDGSINRFGRS